MFCQLMGKIAQGIDRMRDFLSEWNNHVYFRTKKISHPTKDQARVQHTDQIFGLTLLRFVVGRLLFGLFLPFLLR